MKKLIQFLGIGNNTNQPGTLLIESKGYVSKKNSLLALGGLFCLSFGGAALAVKLPSGGIGAVAQQAKGSLGGVAQLITAGSYVAGMGFAVAALAQFKAHKENPAQHPIGKPVALLFTSGALIFAPSVFGTVGGTLYGGSGMAGEVSGVSHFGKS